MIGVLCCFSIKYVSVSVFLFIHISRFLDFLSLPRYQHWLIHTTPTFKHKCFQRKLVVLVEGNFEHII
jgi:hypothetical protein